MAKIETALISVSDKTGIVEFAQHLQKLDVHMISTGGTARHLRANGVNVQEVSDYTGFPEILDGRVKTLHPKVHGGLLALRDNEKHRQEMVEQGIKPIDMVVVNLYPFENTILNPNVALADAIGNIDIGGPTLIRSAAKNYTHTAVLVKSDMYDKIANELAISNNMLSEQTHFELAVEAFRHTARYDRVIANYLSALGSAGQYPDLLVVECCLKQHLLHGENPHQTGAFYCEAGRAEACVGNCSQLSGPELSFNELLDAACALELIKEFDDPAAVMVAHANPFGAATANTLAEAYVRACESNPTSASGCALAVNRTLDLSLADTIATHRVGAGRARYPFAGGVILAPDVEPEAVALLVGKTEWGKRTRVMRTGSLLTASIDETAMDVRRIVAGYLVQSRDLPGWDDESVKVVTERSPETQELRDMKLAWICCKHARSMAIVLANGDKIAGVGAGQPSHYDSLMVAAQKCGESARGSALASDGPLNFTEIVEQAAQIGVKAIVQPGGACKDEAVMQTADKHGISMLFTGVSHFRH